MYRDTEQRWNYRLPVCVKSSGWFSDNISTLSNLAGGKICAVGVYVWANGWNWRNKRLRERLKCKVQWHLEMEVVNTYMHFHWKFWTHTSDWIIFLLILWLVTLSLGIGPGEVFRKSPSWPGNAFGFLDQGILGAYLDYILYIFFQFISTL